jgi:hypothetical protein
MYYQIQCMVNLLVADNKGGGGSTGVQTLFTQDLMTRDTLPLPG